MPGREVITHWAAQLGIDIAPTLAKADMLLAPDPDAMMVGGDQLGTIMEALKAGHQEATQVGTAVRPGWSGASANQFVPTMNTLGQSTQQTTDVLTGAQQHLTSVAEDSAARINAVCNASALTAAYLGAQAVAAAPSAAPPA
jgi:hypothetical protein